jgi:uncharacterized membrane protein YebE (DUF533 family)
MQELTISDLTMRELTREEISQVGGGWTTKGAAMVLGGALVGIAGIIVATLGAPIWLAVGTGAAVLGAAVSALGYAYDVYSEVQQHTPTGTVTVEELIPENAPTTEQVAPSTSTISTSSDLTTEVNAAAADMGYIGYMDEEEYS